MLRAIMSYGSTMSTRAGIAVIAAPAATASIRDHLVDRELHPRQDVRDPRPRLAVAVDRLRGQPSGPQPVRHRIADRSFVVVHIYDVAPTVLYLLGLPVPRDFPGRVVEEVIAADWLEEVPIRRIDSYRPLVPAQPARPLDEERNEAELEELRRLGYAW